MIKITDIDFECKAMDFIANDILSKALSKEGPIPCLNIIREIYKHREITEEQRLIVAFLFGSQGKLVQ